MLVNDSEIFIEKINKERVEKLVTIPSSHSRYKNSMRRNCMNKELNGGPKEEIFQLGVFFFVLIISQKLMCRSHKLCVICCIMKN